MANKTVSELTSALINTGGLYYLVQSGSDTKGTITAAGASMIEAVDVAAQRTLLALGSADNVTFKSITLTGGTITADSPILNITRTWNNAAVAFTALKLNVTDSASDAVSLLADLQVGGVSKFTIFKSGAIGIKAGATQGTISADGSGKIYINSTNSAGAALYGNSILLNGTFSFSGVTASYPMLKRSGTALQVRLADDSAYAPLAASTITANEAFVITSAAINAQTGTTYTLLSSDNGKIITLTNASAITLTVPASLPVGFSCQIIQGGAGQVTFSPSSTTINSYGSLLSLAGQYASASLISNTTDVFVLAGNLI